MKYALLAAGFFVIFEGTFWKVGVSAWEHATLTNVTAVLVATLSFALFVYYTSRQVVDHLRGRESR